MTKTTDFKKNQLDHLEINNLLNEIKDSRDELNIANKSSTTLTLVPVFWSFLWSSSCPEESEWLRIWPVI